MSTPTNFNPPTNPTPYGSNNEGNNSKRMLTMAGVAIAVLLVALIGLLISKYRTGQQLESATLELTEQRAAYTELDTQYKDAVAQLEQQKGINAELDNKINEQLKELADQKAQVEQLIRDNKDYRNGMASLQRQKKEFLAEIDKLKQEIGILTEANTQLTSENQTLNTSLTETQARLDQESSAKAALISEKTQIETERNALGKKVDIASAIKVSNVQVSTVKVTSGGKEKSRSKAKNVDKLKICFHTEANEVTPAGEETFYLRIIDPTGAPLAIESLGSGVATDKRNESDVRYTTTATTNYNNQETDVCGYWQPGQNFVKGKYNVEIYNKGYLVGKGAFKLN
ncbi:MAG: hypothetical protein JNL02_07530 [Saprospiraceae bacterium]|nr:hypothetical protein [Saprospiraceae bacterium]